MSEPISEHGEKESNPSPQGQDVEGLQLQFEQQQTLLAQIKGAVQSNKQKLANKEKEIEECAAMLSSIKSRSKSSKRGSRSTSLSKTSGERIGEDKDEVLEGSSKSVEAEVLVQEETEEKEVERKSGKKSGKNSEKSKLLRKKLEENRMRFEQRGKEMSENKKGIEEMVENLRMQLEERDQVIQTLQKGLERRQNVTSPVPTQELLVEAGHISPDSNVNPESDRREMYAQIVYKDNKIVELNNRIMELELNVLDLQENLKEKDAVIDARTKAITLMSEDMSRKSKSTLDTLDDTREQMRLMQNNFITLEARMKDEKEQLNKQLEEKDRKLKHIEENNKKLESVRFDLTTRIAELQEKVVHLQTINSELQKQMDDRSKQREHRGEKQDCVEELLRTLDESNKQMLKVKAQHKNKVKSLTKQIESLKKVSESGDEILRLQQRVAELEEDKGNLQLHLVDFDELKATEHRWKQRIQELEEKINQQNQDLDSHVHALSHLEEEKLNLIENVQTERLQVSQLESDLKVLKTKTNEVENLKVTAEMKAVELEELVDILASEKSGLLQENKSLSEDRTEYKQLLDALQQEKAELLEEIMALQAQVRESNPGDTDSNRSEFQMVSSNNSDEEKWKRLSTPEETVAEEKHVKDSSNIELSVKLLESELDDARKIISEQKDIIQVLNIKLDSKEEEIEMHLEVISKLEQLGREVGLQEGHGDEVSKISEILKELNEMSGDLEEWKKRCSEVEDRLKCLEDEKIDLERKLEEVMNENSLLNSQLTLQKDVSEELALKLRENKEVLSDKDKLIKEFENIIEQNKLELESKEKELSLFTNNLKSEERSISDDTDQFEIISLKEELQNLKKVCSDYESELAEKEAKLLSVTKEQKEKVEVVDMEQKIGAAVQPTPLHSLEKIEEKDKLIEQLENECKELKHDLQAQRNINEEIRKHKVSSSENMEKIQQLELSLSDKSTALAQKDSELEKLNQKYKNVTEKVKKLAVNLKAKSVVLQNLEEQQKKKEETIKEKEEMVLNIAVEKDKFYKEMETWKLQCEEKDKAMLALSEKLESNLIFQESKIGELVAQNKQFILINETLSSDVSVLSEKLTTDSKLAEERQSILSDQVAELEKQLNSVRNDLCIKNNEIVFLSEQSTLLSAVVEEKKLIDENNMLNEKKNQELIAEILKKEDELAEISLILEELRKEIEIKNEHIDANSVKYKELEQIIVAKDMQITALEDRTSEFQNSWSALDAKLQEREAFIESLEQELAKSNSRQQHLEEGLSFIEERRRSLENKFAALGEQLQESDRIKEEAEEHEGLLENRLAALASSEEILRKRLENLSEQNIDLSQRISELAFENEDLKRNVVNADNNFKTASKEIERLTSCESGYHQALETIENLKGDLKRCTVEFERSCKEKEEKSRQYVENLELDMKNLSNQLTVLETEKRSVMEHCERLNDSKMNLEDDIETMQEKIDASHAKVLELESINNQKESDFKSTITIKEKEIVELKEKIQQVVGELERQVVPLVVETKVMGTQSQVNVTSSDNINQLKSEIETLTNLLTQREHEIQTYQSRLLQLQFSGGGRDNSVAIENSQSELVRQLEASVTEMQEKLKHKDYQLDELKSLLGVANNQINDLQLQLTSSWKKIEEMSGEMCNLQEIVRSKDNELQLQTEKLSDIINSCKLPEKSINSDYQTHLLTLQKQNSQLYQELLQETAKNVVSDVVSTAHLHVLELKTQEVQPPLIENKSRSVRFKDNVDSGVLELGTKPIEYVVENESVQTMCNSQIQNQSSNSMSDVRTFVAVNVGDNSIISNTETDASFLQSAEQNATQELVEKLGDLRAELDAVKNEKESALIKVEQLEFEVNRLHDVEQELKSVQDRLEMLVMSSVEVGSEQFSKESSVDSEYTGGKGVDVVCNEDKIQFASSSTQECIVEGQAEQTLISEQSEITDPTWGGEVIEEGWGWGTEDARLEEEHMQKQKAALSSHPVNDELRQHMLELENKIELLEKEKDKITDELKASQIRSGKMLKKLKDLKLKNESLLRENQELALKKSNEFGSLDLAIEEELKIRIDSLEKELKECKGERDSARVEKDSMQNRIEMLSAVNERLSEQGFDTDYWQNKNKELINQVETLQWRLEELMDEKSGGIDLSKEKFDDWSTSESSTNKPSNHQEVQEQITALAADNEQLQSMLEEQRNLRVAAEAALKDLQQFSSLKEANLLQEETNTKEEYATLRENYNLLYKEVETLRSCTDQDSLIAENSALRENYDVLLRELQQLRSNSNNEIIAFEYSTMRNNYETMYSELEQLRSQVEINNTLQANYESLQMAHDKLIKEMNHMQKEYCDLTQRYEVILKEKSRIQEECSEKTRALQENFESTMNQMQNEKTELVMKNEKMSLEYTVLSSDMQNLRDETEKYKNNISVLTQEQERLNEVNRELNERYEILKQTNQAPLDSSHEKSSESVPSIEESFRPIQFFSFTGTEPATDEVQRSSFATQLHSSIDESNLEKQIKEYKIQIMELENEKQQKVDELSVLRDMFSSEQQEWTNIELNLNQKIALLEGELGMLKEASNRESEIRESLILKEHELTNVRSQLSYLEETLSKTQNKVEDLEVQLVQKEEEFQNVNRNSENQESMIQQILASKEQELSNLQKTLSLKQQEQNELLQGKEKDIENLKLQISDLQHEMENIVTMKDHDLQNMKTQMSEIETRMQTVAEEKGREMKTFHIQLAECNVQIQNLSQLLQDKEQQIIELQEVLEAREDEIREAVIQIRDRNLEIQQLKKSADAVLENSPLAQVTQFQAPNENEADSQQNELDLALYMLHQRDVRCEELTLELMQLLEERDTLQLRLSTAIRINEELRNKITKASNTSSPLRVPSTHPLLETTASSSELTESSEKTIAPIEPEPITNTEEEEPKEDLKVLADKLSQLHSVDYRKDVTLQDEREQRHSEQVMLLQSRGPGVLVESNYTLSRDVQSPSTVLLNWIWGRSTPKVMHI